MKKLTTIVAGALFLALAAGGQQAGAGGPPPPLDFFKCTPLISENLNPKPIVTLEDQFEVDNDEVIKPSLICNPASVEDSGTFNNGHLACFLIRGLTLLAAPLKVRVDNIFGEQEFTVRRAESYLCTPSDKTCLDDDGNSTFCPNED